MPAPLRIGAHWPLAPTVLDRCSQFVQRVGTSRCHAPAGVRSARLPESPGQASNPPRPPHTFSSLGTASQMARVVSIAAELYVTTRRCGDAAAPGAARLATAPDGTADISPARTPVLGTHAGCLSDSWNVCGSSQPRAPLRGWRCLEACPCGGSDWPRSSLRSFA